MFRYLIVALLLLLSLASWFGWRAETERRLAVDRVTRLEAELAKRGVVLPQMESAPVQQTPLAAPKYSPPAREAVDVGKYLRMIDELRARSQELEKELNESRLEAEQANEKTIQKAEELRKTTELLASVREDAIKQQRVSEALETELRFKAQRLVQSETNEKLSQEKLQKAEQASKRVVIASKEVEDLNRRREAALMALERRYREVTDLYRNFSLNLQTRETPGQGLQAGDLSRIQNALQQAEEELRQLRTLNARVAELAKAK